MNVARPPCGSTIFEGIFTDLLAKVVIRRGKEPDTHTAGVGGFNNSSFNGNVFGLNNTLGRASNTVNTAIGGSDVCVNAKRMSRPKDIEGREQKGCSYPFNTAYQRR